VGRSQAASLLESSFAQFQADRSVVSVARRLRRAEAQAESVTQKAQCDRGDFMEYASLRRQLTDAERDASRSRASSRRAQALRSLSGLKRGDIIKVPAGRRSGLAVVLEPPPDPGDFSVRHHADGPLVLTFAGQVKHLAAADFTSAVEPIERLKIPASFSPRSPKHRRDLVSAMRSKLAGREFDDGPAARRGANSGADDGADGDVTGEGGDGATGDIAELRRKLRRHPCHSCPDREQHARLAEKYFRQQKEIEDLRRQIGSRSHVIARTFGKVCTVLDQLGYLDGDTVTPDGQRLARLYSELDLLAAECLRRGFWDGLNPAELAACVSVLTFESRSGSDDEPPARMPKGPVSGVLTAMTKTWAELDQLEKRNGLSFLRESDPGFVWAAYRWVRGASLEDVLDSAPGLTPGDFVRSVKQLIDILDQIAVAASKDPAPKDPAATDPAATDPPANDPANDPASKDPGGSPGVAPRDRDVAATARAAIDEMRRGVVAYSMLAD
jgi:ATP-dependent RNA helicase HelY